MRRYPRMVKPVRIGGGVSTGSRRMEERFPLDYATWYARIAAPGSTMESTRLARLPIVHLDTVNRGGGSAAVERRTA